VRRRLAAALLVAASMAPGARGTGDARAQVAPNRAVEFEDLGFTATGETGLRAAGLRAFAATANDASALVLNTAGLARVKRINGAVVMAHASSRIDLDYGNGATGQDVSATYVAFAGFAYPLRVLRGSLVPAFSVHRAFDSGLDLAYTRDNIRDGRAEDFRIEQSGATYAYTFGVGTDLSPVLSAGISAFVLNGSVDTHRRYDWQPLVTTPDEHTFVLEDIKSDVGGYGAQIGLQLYFHPRVQAGVRFNTPTVVKLHATSVREETRQVQNDVGSFVRQSGESETEYILPYRLDGAIALPLGALLLTAQISYADWGEAAIDGHRLYTRPAETVMDKVLGFSAGAEWSLPRWPLRLRAGVEHAPAPLKYMETDRIDGDALASVDSQSGRTRIALGAGALLFTRVVVDAVWIRSEGSRETSAFDEDYSSSIVSLQGSYWF
jgi:hypothetical protein